MFTRTDKYANILLLLLMIMMIIIIIIMIIIIRIKIIIIMIYKQETTPTTTKHTRAINYLGQDSPRSPFKFGLRTPAPCLPPER